MAKAAATIKELEPIIGYKPSTLNSGQYMFGQGKYMYGPIIKSKIPIIEEPYTKTKKKETERPTDIVQPMEVEDEPMEIEQTKRKTKTQTHVKTIDTKG